MAVFPSMKSRALLSVLQKQFGYIVVSSRGSHKKLKSDRGYPTLLFAFHDGVEVPPGLVKKILVRDVGLSETEALDCLD